MPRARAPGAKQVLEAARLWVDRGLLSDDSLFTQGVVVWSDENLTDLYERLVERPDESSNKNFDQKLEHQLNEAPDSVIQLAAELLYVYLLPAGFRTISATKKLEIVERTLTWMKHPPTLPIALVQALSGAIASAGPGFNFHRPFLLACLMRFAIAFRSLPLDERRKLLDDPWTFKAFLDTIDSTKAQTQREALLHLIHSETFEPILSHDMKVEIASGLGDRVVEPTDDIDHQLWQIRQSLQAEYGEDFDLWDPPIKVLWDGDDANVSQKVWWVNQGATFEQERAGGYVWAPTTTRAGRSVQHHLNVAELGPGQIVLHYANGAIRSISEVASPAYESERPDELPEGLWDVSGYRADVQYFDLDRPIELTELDADLRSGEAGPFTRSGSVKQGYMFELLPAAAESLRTQFQQRWPRTSPWSSGEQTIHLLFKWNLEREPRTVQRHKEVEDQYGSVWWGKFGSRERSALSAKNLNKIRDQLDREIATHTVLYRPGEVWLANLQEITADPADVVDELLPSYYTKDECELFVRLASLRKVEDTWPLENLVLASNSDPDKLPGALANQRTPLMVNFRTDISPPTSVTQEELTMEWLLEKTLWTEAQLEPLIEALRGTSRQIVLAGPPGTGKTWVAKHVARFLAQDGSAHQTVQFHPSYGYEEFIEGLRPVIGKDGALTFEVKKGIVREMVDQIDNPDQMHVLVIDEMNRANLSRVFGELMYLFEYRDDPINLQYTNDFELPTNLVFIGTMNTADRSIRSIDIALRRRFDVFECPPDSDVLTRFYSGDNQNDVPDLVTGFESLNAELEQQLDRHHTIGHTFFMEEHMTKKRLTQIWDRQLKPLIEEYFFDQPDIAAELTLERFWTSD